MKRQDESTIAEPARPEAWKILFQNELELAKRNYDKEEDRHKIVTDKAKTVFTLAGLSSALGVPRLDSVLPSILHLHPFWRTSALLLVTMSFVCMVYAVIGSILVLHPRNFKALSDPAQYVHDMFADDEDAMNRALSDIYRRTANHNCGVNDHLTNILRKCFVGITFGIVAGALFLMLYGTSLCYGQCATAKKTTNHTSTPAAASTQNGSMDFHRRAGNTLGEGNVKSTTERSNVKYHSGFANPNAPRTQAGGTQNDK